MRALSGLKVGFVRVPHSGRVHGDVGFFFKNKNIYVTVLYTVYIYVFPFLCLVGRWCAYLLSPEGEKLVSQAGLEIYILYSIKDIFSLPCLKALCQFCRL